MSSPPRVSTWRWPLAVFAALALVWGVMLARNLALALRFEDAMIVLRYARNIAEGHGFVFNPGERVLGVTTPLYTVLSVLWIQLGGSDGAPAWQNLFGLICLAGEGLLVVLLGRRLGWPTAGLLAGLATLGNFRQSYLYLGMETHLFALLVLLILFLAQAPVAETGAGAEGARQPALALLGAMLGLAFLVRYDAALLALLLGLESWRRQRRLPWRLALGFAVVVAPWLIFASVYFGSFVPQSLGAKESYVTAPVYLHAFFDLWRVTFVQLFELYSAVDRANFWVSFLFPGILLLGAGVLAAGDNGKNNGWWVVYPFGHLAVYAAIGADPAFQWHLYPLGPLFFLFTAVAALFLLERLASFWPRLGDPRLQVAATLLALIPLAAHLYRHASYRFELDPHSRQLFTIGAFLREHYPPETSLLQPSIGILGYASGLRLIDHAGLVTPGLYYFHDAACTPLPEVLAQYQPDLLLFGPWSPWTPEKLAPLGYQLAQEFQGDFVYKLYRRAA